jgi:hypothetical protein
MGMDQDARSARQERVIFVSSLPDGEKLEFLILGDGGWAIDLDGRRADHGGKSSREIDHGVAQFLALGAPRQRALPLRAF